MSHYELQFNQNERILYRCPLKESHVLSSLEKLIEHLTFCKQHPNVIVKRFVCRFNHFHWFETKKMRILHEYFECNNRTTTMSHNECIINQENELCIPLNREHEFQLRKYFHDDNAQKRPNFRNFITQYKENIEEIQLTTKRMKQE